MYAIVEATLAPRGIRLVPQPEAGQRRAGEACTEFLECATARDRLGNTVCEFVEFALHTFFCVS